MHFSELLLSMPAGTEWIPVLVMLAVAMAALIFWIYSIVDIVQSKFSDDITKIIWLLVVLLTGIIGSFIYWVFGRSTKLLQH